MRFPKNCFSSDIARIARATISPHFDTMVDNRHMDDPLFLLASEVNRQDEIIASLTARLRLANNVALIAATAAKKIINEP